MDHFGFSSELRRPTTQDKCASLFIHSVDNGDVEADGKAPGSQPERMPSQPSFSRLVALKRRAGGVITLLPYCELYICFLTTYYSKKKEKVEC